VSKFQEKALVWFRRDLRDFDHAALYHAPKAADETGAASRGSDLIVKHGVASSEILQLAQALDVAGAAARARH